MTPAEHARWRRRRGFLRAGLAMSGVAAASGYRVHAASVIDAQGPGRRAREAEGGRVVLDVASFPTDLQEAPMLRERVEKGVLRPVRERIGQDPLVIAPLQDIGRYGGTLRRGFVGPSDIHGATRFAAGPDGLLYWDYTWSTVLPNIARAFALSDDARVLTLELRRGMRWSDGAPFTSDDIVFWYEDMYGDRNVVPSRSSAMRIAGSEVALSKVDDTTVRFVSQASNPLLPELLAGFSDIGGPSIAGRYGMGAYAPKHYLSRFHPRYRSEDEVTRAARRAGFANWGLYLRNRNDWVLNPELPVLSPWKVVSPINTPSFVLERNPYSIWVDTAGNQLPYIDRIKHTLCSGPEIVNFKAAAGEFDFQDRHLDVAKLPFLIGNEKRSRYRVYLDPYEGTDLGIRVNLAYREDPEIGDWLRTLAFRRALSLAIDRDSINDSFMLGTGRPGASVPAPDNKFYPGDDWVTRWARYDVNAANRLLDGLGLVERDAAGFRLRKDGRGRLRLVFQASVAYIDFPAVGEMIREHWRAVGIDLDVRVTEVTAVLQKSVAGLLQLTAQSVGSEDPFAYPDLLFPFATTGGGSVMGVDYARWFQSEGSAGVEPFFELKQMMALWRSGYSAAPEERIRIGRQLIRMHVDQVLSIGLIGAGLSYYGIHLAKDRLRNVPRRVVNTQIVRSPANALPMTFYFVEEPKS